MATDTALVGQTVSSILGFGASAAEATAAATGQGFAAQGAAAQQGAYGQAGDYAEQMAATEEMSGQIQQYQENRAVQQTIGAQRAGIAASGFKASGTFLQGLAGSLRQGYLTQQITGVQTGLTASGFRAQAAAARGAGAAAGYASAAATALQTAETGMAKTSAANQAAETQTLMGYMTSTGELKNTFGNTVTPGPNMTPEGNLVTSVLNPNVNPSSPINTTGMTWMPGANGMPTYAPRPGVSQNFYLPGATSFQSIPIGVG